MIKKFNELETRNSGVIYNSTLEQIKKLYAKDPVLAGELAISAIELVLTGDISSDDMIVDVMLEPMKKINENNKVKHDAKVENAKRKKIVEQKLDQIAELLASGMKQREIGERLGLSQQIVSYRAKVIKEQFPELLQKNSFVLQKNKEEVQEESFVLQENLQKNKNTKKQKFVQNEEFCKFVEEDESPQPPSGKDLWNSTFSF